MGISSNNRIFIILVCFINWGGTVCDVEQSHRSTLVKLKSKRKMVDECRQMNTTIPEQKNIFQPNEFRVERKIGKNIG